MKYEHPSIVIDQPAAGHYVIYGHHPQPAKNEEGQTVVPLQQCYITPEVPSDALIAILEERSGAALLENGLSAQAGIAGVEPEGRRLVALNPEGTPENHGEKLGRNGDSHGCRSRVTGRRDVAPPVEVPPGPSDSGLAASSRNAAAKKSAKQGGGK